MAKSKWRLYVLLTLLFCILALDQFVAYTHAVPSFLKSGQFNTDFSNYLLQHPFLCYLAYAAIYFILTSVGMPGIRYVLIAAGSMLDLYPAIIISSLIGTLGTLPAYFAGRFVFRAWIHSHYAGLMMRMRRHAEKDALSYLFALRMSAIVPNIFINLIYGSAQFSRWPAYIIVSFLGLLPNVALYITMGHLLRLGTLGPLWSRIDLLLIAISVMPLLLKKAPFFKRFNFLDE